MVAKKNLNKKKIKKKSPTKTKKVARSSKPKKALPQKTFSPSSLSISATVSPSQPSNSKIRVLVAKPGLDGHDRGAKVIARALRDAGFEVIYTGLHQTPEMVITAAIEEDVQVVGLSILSGAHNALVPEIIRGVKKAGLNDALFIVGGIIPDEDMASLKKAGTHMIFTPGASLTDVVEYIRQNAPRRG